MMSCPEEESEEFEEMSEIQISLYLGLYVRDGCYSNAASLIFDVYRRGVRRSYMDPQLQTISNRIGVDLVALLDDSCNFTIVLNYLTEYWNEMKIHTNALNKRMNK